jgi:3-hydroxyisobutyrate dehydrogenase
LKLARKDLGLATELARENGVPMPLANMVEQDLIEAIAHGLADKDSTVAFTIQEDRAGVKVRDNSSR